MMKHLKLVFVMALCALFAVANGQVSDKRGLQISYNKTTSVIFPSAIKSVDRGTQDVMAQKAKGVENVLQLKAAKRNFDETNLTVITVDGSLHHFFVNYSPQPDKMIYTIGESQPSPSLMFPEKLTETKLAEYGRWIAKAKRTGLLINRRKYKISFGLYGIYARENTLFFHLKVKNRSNINYDIQSLRFYVRDKKQMKRTATQEIEKNTLLVYGIPDETIKGKSAIDLIYAIEKFTIPDAKRLAIEMFEDNGGRNLKLSINNRMIIKARSLPDLESHDLNNISFNLK